MTPAAFSRFALSFEGATEQPHFKKRSFRVSDRIFATLGEEGNKAVLKLSPVHQSLFCTVDPSAVYPASKSWGAGRDGPFLR